MVWTLQLRGWNMAGNAARWLTLWWIGWKINDDKRNRKRRRSPKCNTHTHTHTHTYAAHMGNLTRLEYCPHHSIAPILTVAADARNRLSARISRLKFENSSETTGQVALLLHATVFREKLFIIICSNYRSRCRGFIFSLNRNRAKWCADDCGVFVARRCGVATWNSANSAMILWSSWPPPFQ